jgi:hypothetical protein
MKMPVISSPDWAVIGLPIYGRQRATKAILSCQFAPRSMARRTCRKDLESDFRGWKGLTSPARSSSASTPRLPDADHSAISQAVEQEISRFPCKERTHMPGSKTTHGRTGTHFIAPIRVAFCYADSVGTLNLFRVFAAQWLACRLPSQCFVSHLATRYATRGQSGLLFLYCFDFHHFTLCAVSRRTNVLKIPFTPARLSKTQVIAALDRALL